MTTLFKYGTRGEDAAAGSQFETLSGGNGNAGYSARDVGAMLRERREAMAVSLAEVESATRIRQKYLAALESDEWHLLPGEVVGRGFLRNYAGYLGLEPTDVVDRRRLVADEDLASVLSSTSAGSALPPVRQVDYRPKDVELKDEPDGMERREIRTGPIIAALTALLLAWVLWAGRGVLANAAGSIAGGVQSLAAGMFSPSTPELTPATDPAVGVIAAETDSVTPDPIASAAQASAPSTGDGIGQDAGEESISSSNGSGGDKQIILVPTATSLPASDVATAPADRPNPTSTPFPLPTPTNTPELLPTPTPLLADAAAAIDAPAPAEPEEAEPDEPLVQAPVCPDARSVISEPGIGEVVVGSRAVIGTATHEAFQYYKLEYAAGANAGGGFVYFGGGSDSVTGGLLGSLDSTALPNGDYTLQVIVVDQTGNFPPPCTVNIVIQN